jgi:hypothetical protein
MSKVTLVTVAGMLLCGLFLGCRNKAEDSQNGDGEEPKGHTHGSAAHVHADKPTGVGGTPFERELYLTPGGLYSEADIKANGNVVPSQKFTGISWPHDDELKTGDKVCPVTANKADERCYWIVNSRKYEFCCTPCLDKFVKWAKEKPDRIKEPTEYIHK